MQEFLSRVNTHVEHVKRVGVHCTTEETTKQALILPLLDILGFNPYDPTKLRAEHGADFPGAKNHERVDYALFCHGVPVMYVEAKSYTEKLTNHSPQLSRYFNSTPDVTIGVITNGREWRFFTDLVAKNVMDTSPFLVIDFLSSEKSDFIQLYQFRHDEFQPEKLRTLAEESIYLNAFKQVISSSLKEIDQDFVKYVANKANIQKQLNVKFLEMIAPLVKQAVERAVSEMVVSGLSAPVQQQPIVEPVKSILGTSDEVNPENSKIVTTASERKVLSIIQDILGESIEIVGKDTETYFSALYAGKTNRWLIRYFGDRKKPFIQFIIELDDLKKSEIKRAGLELSSSNQVFIEKPEDLYRLAGIINDCLGFCTNDENFKVKKDK